MAKQKAKTRDLEALKKKAKEQKRADKIWNPAKDGEAGDQLAGTVEAMRWIKSSDNKDDEGKPQKYLSVLLVDENGELWVHNCGIILQQEFESRGVKLGDNIAIEYRGKDGRTGIFVLATEEDEE